MRGPPGGPIPRVGGRLGGCGLSSFKRRVATPSIGTMNHAIASDRRTALRIVIYSASVTTRSQVQLALGRRPHPDLPEIDYVEVATQPALIDQVESGGVDLAILDGETTPAGGLGCAKQLKDEFDPCPPILVLTGRADDAWLARWSRAEASVSHPIDPIRLAGTVISLLRASPVCA